MVADVTAGEGMARGREGALAGVGVVRANGIGGEGGRADIVVVPRGGRGWWEAGGVADGVCQMRGAVGWLEVGKCGEEGGACVDVWTQGSCSGGALVKVIAQLIECAEATGVAGLAGRGAATGSHVEVLPVMVETRGRLPWSSEVTVAGR